MSFWIATKRRCDARERNRRLPATATKGGFTLTEMLTVVVIIALLVGLLIPLVGKMRTRGFATDSAAQIQALRSAIEQYFTDHRAYPGPLRDEQIFGINPLPANLNGSVTGSENLTLGLLGGLQPDPADPGGPGRYEETNVGKGAKSLNSRNPKTFRTYMDNWRDMTSAGKFIEVGADAATLDDSEIPEFLDRFPSDPMPVLYLRARIGAHGVVTEPGNYGIPNRGEWHQYDLRYIQPYTAKKIYGQDQRLNTVGTAVNSNQLVPLSGTNWDALRYLINPGILPPDMSSDSTANEGGTPRSKDMFILIGAGIDRVYGTTDDITSFGAIE